MVVLVFYFVVVVVDPGEHPCRTSSARGAKTKAPWSVLFVVAYRITNNLGSEQCGCLLSSGGTEQRTVTTEAIANVVVTSIRHASGCIVVALGPPREW